VPEDRRYARYDVDSGLDSRSERERDKCSWLYRGAFINWDGWVWPCCYFPSFEQSKFGDIREEDFMRIWNSERYVTARKLFNKREKGYDRAKAAICHLCTTKYGED